MPEKELPELSVTREGEPYWEAAREERLVIQHCVSCEEFVFPPRCACPYCLSSDLEWTETAGTGTVYTYSTVHVPPSPAWEDDVPYTLAVVLLDEGVYIFTEITNCESDEVELRKPVKVTFEHVTDDVTLPKFELAD